MYHSRDRTFSAETLLTGGTPPLMNYSCGTCPVSHYCCPILFVGHALYIGHGCTHRVNPTFFLKEKVWVRGGPPRVRRLRRQTIGATIDIGGRAHTKKQTAKKGKAEIRSKLTSLGVFCCCWYPLS